MPLLLLLLASPFIERLDPPVLERGKTTRLTPVGAGLDKPVGLWTTLPADKINAKPAAAGLDVRVAADAPVGVFGLRVATPDGLSNVHLFLVDDLPVRKATSGKQALPCALWGTFREGESDRFTIDVKAGQEVAFEAVGSRLGKEVDPLVTIRDSRGKPVAEIDSSPGLYFDCRFRHVFEAAGSYTVEVRDSRFQGHPHGSYVLRMGRFPAARVAVPATVPSGKKTKLHLPEIGASVDVETAAEEAVIKRPGDEGSSWVPVILTDADVYAAPKEATSPKGAAEPKAPGVLAGALPASGRQLFRLPLEKGQVVFATAHGRRLNSPAELEIALTDEKGNEVRRAAQGEDDTARFDFTAPRTGDYFLSVRDTLREGGPACAYLVELRGERTPPAVMAEVEGLTVPRGGHQIVPLVATRNGDNAAIPLSLEGAPPGVTLTPDEIPAGVSSVVCRLHAAADTPLGLHTLRIRAGKAPVRTRPMIDRQLLNVDLIPYTLREDQRRLPPSVTDRLALQITEPAPFTFEIAADAVVLPRYQHAPIPIITTRSAGFDGPITFTARGGQLADKAEGRTRVYADFAPATPKSPRPAASVHSRILANLGKSRIEVLASAIHAGRRVTLIRSFELEIRTAFTLTVPKDIPKLIPGASAKVRIGVERVGSFTGPVEVTLSPQDGLDCPEKVTIPAGKDGAEIEVHVRDGTQPGRRGVRIEGTADVDGFEEEGRARIDIEVPRPEVPKKK